LRLRESHGLETIFVAAATSAATETAEGFPVRSPLRAVASGLRPEMPASPIILHYVNYGYDRRGVPLRLPRLLRELTTPGRLLTIFHELYALGSIRQSAFWLRPLQKQIARSVAGLSQSAVVSSEVSRDLLRDLAPGTRIIVHPVLSNFGEPDLSPGEIAERDPHRWIICGRSDLIERSLRSFLERAGQIDPACAPRELFVVGGAENSTTRRILEQQRNLQTHYYPEVEANAASMILASCAFAWLDYFVRPDEPIPAILKSSSFAAFCAHGVIPVGPTSGAAVGLGPDRLPGPFFVSPAGQSLPSASERTAVAQSIYSWYQRNACSAHLAATIAIALGHSTSSEVRPEIDIGSFDQPGPSDAP
jgi:hypothetical protein